MTEQKENLETWESGRHAYRENKQMFNKKIDRIAVNILDFMNNEEILLSEVDAVLYRIKAATTSQAEAALERTIVKVLV